MTDTLTLDDLPQPEYDGTLPTDELDTDGENPNEMSDDQFGLLCDRMRNEGWLGGPILTNTDGLIADGEHRWRAAQEIGLEEVPVRQYDIDDAERRLWRQEMNKNQGEHDSKRDALEYDYLLNSGKADDVHALTNATDEDLDELLAEIKVKSEKHVPYEYNPDHNIYFEDCIEGMAERVKDDSVDCVITDPPYGVDVGELTSPNRRGDSRHSDKIFGDSDIEGAIELFSNTVSQLKRVLKPSGHLYSFAPSLSIGEFMNALEVGGFEIRNILVWEKNNHVIPFSRSKPLFCMKYEPIIFAIHEDGDEARAFQSDTIPQDILSGYSDARHESGNKGKQNHPTQKPTSLISDLFGYSTSEGDTVLDPFMGSGTTAVAAIQNNRDYIGFELDEENYRSVIEKRIGEAKRQMDSSQNTTNRQQATDGGTDTDVETTDESG